MIFDDPVRDSAMIPAASLSRSSFFWGVSVSPSSSLGSGASSTRPKLPLVLGALGSRSPRGLSACFPPSPSEKRHAALETGGVLVGDKERITIDVEAVRV